MATRCSPRRAARSSCSRAAASGWAPPWPTSPCRWASCSSRRATAASSTPPRARRGPAPGSRVKLQAHDGGTRFEVGLGTLELLDLDDGGASTVKAGERFVVGLGVVSETERAGAEAAARGEKPKVKLTSARRGDAQAEVGPEREARPPRAASSTRRAPSRSIARASCAPSCEGSGGGVRRRLQRQPGAGLRRSPAWASPWWRAARGVFLKAGESVLLGGKKPLTGAREDDARPCW